MNPWLQSFPKFSSFEALSSIMTTSKTPIAKKLDSRKNRKEKLQIIILSRDRLESLKKTIQSALEQKVDNVEIEVFVSDNSINNDVENFIDKYCSGIKYIRRRPSLDVWGHYQLAIKDADGDFVVLFHDDDVLLPDYCEKMMSAFSGNPTASAIGCNAIKVNERGEDLGVFHGHRNDRVISEERWLLSQYIPKNVKEKGIAPFPSYCYRFESLDVSHVNASIGPCGDVYFIAEKLKSGPIIWLAQPLMKYTVHSESGSGGLTPNDYRKLWRYMVARGIDKRSADFKNWRIGIWAGWYFKHKGNNSGSIIPRNWREAIVHRVVIRNYIKRPSQLLLRMMIGYGLYFARELQNRRTRVKH